MSCNSWSVLKISQPQPRVAYRITTPTPVNSENTGDARSSVTINGVAQPPYNHTPPNNGTWPWEFPPGDVVTYNWNISTGMVANVANVADPEIGNVSNQGLLYRGPIKQLIVS